MKESVTDLLIGTITFSKKEVCLLITSCTLLGIIIGLLTAPLTHGVTLFSHNGNGNTKCWDDKREESDRITNRS